MTQPCPDCHGTGEIRLFTSVEPCRTCCPDAPVNAAAPTERVRLGDHKRINDLLRLQCEIATALGEIDTKERIVVPKAERARPIPRPLYFGNRAAADEAENAGIHSDPLDLRLSLDTRTTGEQQVVEALASDLNQLLSEAGEAIRIRCERGNSLDMSVWLERT